MREIFDTVRGVMVAPSPNSGQLEIKIWPTDDQDEPELSEPLNNCGTGISQALAILTVAMTFKDAIILIDEINSFLHPAAAKALIRILQTNYGQHQYIITTHSLDMVNVTHPDTVHIVRKRGFESTVESISVGDVEVMAAVARELGISMADVLASDRVVWVEGPTEELCFSFIWERCRPKTETDTLRFVSLVATGDFDDRVRRRLIEDIYRRLTVAASPLVSGTAFGFDRELLPDSEVKEIEARSTTHTKLLKRRLFECYLLVPQAIADAINADLFDDYVTAETVEQDLVAVASSRVELSPVEFSGDIRSVEWLSKVDAARILGALFPSVTGSRLEYRKTKHGLVILKNLWEANQGAVSELRDYVLELAALTKR